MLAHLRLFEMTILFRKCDDVSCSRITRNILAYPRVRHSPLGHRLFRSFSRLPHRGSQRCSRQRHLQRQCETAGALVAEPVLFCQLQRIASGESYAFGARDDRLRADANGMGGANHISKTI